MRRLIQRGYVDFERVMAGRQVDDRAIFFYGASFVCVALQVAAKRGVSYAMEGHLLVEKRNLDKLLTTIGELGMEAEEFMRTEPFGQEPRPDTQGESANGH